MLQMAQDMLKVLQNRFRTTLRLVTDLAESVGVPSAVTTLLHRLDGDGNGRQCCASPAEAPSAWSSPFAASPPAAAAPAGNSTMAGMAAGDSYASCCGQAKPHCGAADASHACGGATIEDDDGAADRPRATVKRRAMAGGRELPPDLRALEVDDAINGSTYLARIVWSLGVAEREGLGSLRPADMARMIMSRSPVSLEPPNVARYIRRSKPTCLVVDRTEGSSSFYRLNDEGRAIFAQKFKVG